MTSVEKNKARQWFGICPLCQKRKILCKSHLIPKGLYRDIHYDNEYIVKIFENKTTIPPGTGQITSYLLCKDCENILGRPEKNVIRDKYRCDRFPLLEKINNSDPKHPFSEDSEQFVIFPDECNFIDWHSYVLFALSVFWRCSVAEGVNEVQSYHNALGIYQDLVRDILVFGKNELPNNMYLIIYVNNNHLKFFNLILTPNFNNCLCYNFHYFVIPNVIFFLFVGEHIPKPIMDVRELHGAFSIFTTDFFKTEFSKEIFRIVRNTTSFGRANKILK